MTERGRGGKKRKKNPTTWTKMHCLKERVGSCMSMRKTDFGTYAYDSLQSLEKTVAIKPL